ncbi:MAG: M12 family metallo-peptidase [Ferruginibacter sp.]
MKKPLLYCYVLAVLAMTFSLSPSFAQNIVQQKKQTPAALLKYVKKASVFSLDKTLTNDILRNRPASLELQVEFEGRIIYMQLEEHNIFAKGFFVKDGHDKKVRYDPQSGIHYKGKIKGDTRSVIALNIYPGTLDAVLADKNGNINIGPLDDNAANDMVMYRESDLVTIPAWGCEALPVPGNENVLPDFTIPASLLEEVVNTEAVDIYYEADYSCYTGKGSDLAATISWVTSLANNVTVLYNNDSVNLQMSAIKVWTVNDPYASYATTATALPAFAAAMTNGFPGDLAHLLSRRGLGGGRAYLDVLCSSAYFRTGVSGNLNNGITPLPTYSWNSMVITHEIGHNIVSNHTQWCGWPGGAIDNCYAVEGTCSPGPAPVNGGTIMSYCHLTVGINLSNGFGPLPGAAIRNKLRTNTCIYPKVNFSKTSETVSEESADIDNDCLDYKLITVRLGCSYAPVAPAEIQIIPTVLTAGLETGPGKDVEVLGPLSFTLNDTLSQEIQLKVYDDAIIEPNESLRLDFSIGSGTNAVKGTLYTLTISNTDHKPDSTVNQLVYYEDFETASAASWTTAVIYGTPSPNRWVIGNSGQTDFPGTSAFVSNNGSTAGYSGSSASDTSVLWLASPVINSTGFTSLRLTYALKCLGEGGAIGGTGQPSGATDFGRVYYSGNGGNSWVLLKDNIYGRSTRGSDEVSLPSGANNNSNLRLAFEWRNNTSVVNNPPFIIDSIMLKGTGPGIIQSAAHPSNSDTAYLGPNTTVHFYNQVTGNIMASVKNLSSFDFGCTQVDLIRTGINAVATWGLANTDHLTDKAYRINTSNYSPSATYEVSLYATADEIAGWVSATGNAATDLRVIQSIADITDPVPLNAPVYGSSASNALFGSKGDRIIKAVFKNNPWYGLGKPAIPNVCTGTLKQFAAEISGTAYQWQVDAGSGYSNITDNAVYGGSASAVLNLSNAPTSWYGYKYRCLVSTVGGPQYTAEKELQFSAVWKGGVSNVWELPANWECGVVPDANTDVYVTNVPSLSPVVNSSTSIRTLTLLNGASVTANGSTQLTILK